MFDTYSIFFHAICCIGRPHTSIHKGGGASRRLHKGGRAAFGGLPPFVDSFMDGPVGADEASGVTETWLDARITSTCMRIA